MDRDRNRFTRQLWLAIALFVLLTASFAVYTWSEKRIDHANDLRISLFCWQTSCANLPMT